MDILGMEVQHHIQCRKGDVGRFVFLPGDPGRVPLIAASSSTAMAVDGQPMPVEQTDTFSPSTVPE